MGHSLIHKCGNKRVYCARGDPKDPTRRYRFCLMLTLLKNNLDERNHHLVHPYSFRNLYSCVDASQTWLLRVIGYDR